MDGLWGLLPFLFFMIVFFLLPRLRQQKQHEELTKKFSSIQRKRKSRVIAIVHRQEPMGLLGMPVLKYIDLNDAEDVLEAIRQTPDDMPLEIMLHTPGGLVLPALQIARAIKAHPGPTSVFIPHYAMSGGTLIALAADEVVMSQHAVLGPIDPQIGGLPAASVLRVKQEKDVNATDDYTLILADVSEMAIRQLQSAAYELLSGTVSDNAAKAIAEQLSAGRWTHDYPIIPSHAEELGLNVTTQMPQDIMTLMALFPSSLAGASVKAVDVVEAKSASGHQSGHRKGQTDQGEKGRVPISGPAIGRGAMTGYQPGAGANSFSYGPWKEGSPENWNSKNINPASQAGPFAQETGQETVQEKRATEQEGGETVRKRKWYRR